MIDAIKKNRKEFDEKRHEKKLKRVPKEIKNDKNYIDTFTLMEKKQIEEIRKKRALKMFEDKVLKISKLPVDFEEI